MHQQRRGSAADENVQANNEASSFPLVDFISKWRLRDRRRSPTAPSTDGLPGQPAASSVNQVPLLGDACDVPYPLPDAFLLPKHHRAGEPPDDGLFEDSDEDDAQSIQSYGSDHIRTYDRLSLSRVSSSDAKSSWPPDDVQGLNNANGNNYDEILDELDEAAAIKHQGLCSNLLSSFCLPNSTIQIETDTDYAIEMQSKNNSKRDKKKRKARSLSSVV